MDWFINRVPNLKIFQVCNQERATGAKLIGTINNQVSKKTTHPPIEGYNVGKENSDK